MDEDRLLTALTRFDFSQFANITNYYLLNCLGKVFVKTERKEIRAKIMEFLRKVQNGRVKMSNVARVKAVETKQLLSLDEEQRKEIFDEVPQGQLPENFSQ